jgi:hypothetical protein
LVGRRITMKDVWPALSVVMSWTAASCRLYLPRVLERYGDGVKVQQVLSNSSEGPLTMVSTDHLTAGPPCITDVFYEFLPVDATDARTRLLDELEVGGEYEIVMTQSCGLYRYAIGDVFRVAEMHEGAPLIEFVGRKDVVSSFTGEKLTEAHVQEALAAVADARIAHATCFPRWSEPPFYVFVVESARADVSLASALARQLDAELSRHNEEYASKRETARLGPAHVHLVGPGTFTRFRDLLASRGTAPDQVKHKLIYRDDSMYATLVELSPHPVVASC